MIFFTQNLKPAVLIKITLTLNYLSNRKQRIKKSSSHSDWHDIINSTRFDFRPIISQLICYQSFFLLKEQIYAILPMINNI